MNSLFSLPLTSPALLGPLVMFALVSSITPGPNNAMLASSGLTFGLRRTVPHMLGVSLGFAFMVLLVGLGLGAVFTRQPMVYEILKYVGAAYLLYLAWKIANSGSIKEGAARGKPFTFMQAAIFQWVNPKAWVMAVGVIATYTPQQGFFGNLMIATLVCAIINLPCVGLWAVFGSTLRHWLHRPEIVRSFNITMALLLVASLYPVAVELANR
jgi:threonine/homoserine/homoserine lactone efflux protein